MAVIRLPDKIFTGDYSDVVAPVSGDNGKAFVWNNAAQRAEWVSVAASPGGSSGQVQYNNSGAFAGHSGFIYDGAGKVTLTVALVSPVWKPSSDGTAALKIKTASDSNFVTIDTTNKRIGVNRNPSAAQLEFAQSGASVERALDFYDNNNNARLTLFTNGQLNLTSIPSTGSLTANSSSSVQFYSSRWDGAASQSESIEMLDIRYDSGIGRHALWIRDGTGNVLMAFSGGSKGQVSVGNAFPADAQSSKGKLWVVSPDTAWKAATFHVLTGATVDIVDFQKNGVVQFAIGNDGKLKTNQAVTNTNTPSGATTKAMPIYGVDGTLLGYIPVYTSQW